MRDPTPRAIAPALVFALLALAALPGPRPAAAADGSLARVQQAHKLLVAVDATYPPMEFERGGEVMGFDVDFARELARRLDVAADFVVMDWNGITAGLHSGRYDAIISSMNITDERRREVDFVEYVRMAQLFVCARGVRVEGERDLAGRVVAVQADTTSFSYVDGLRAHGVAVRDVKAFKDATDTFAAVKSGQAEVIVTDEPVGRYYARRDPAFVVTGQALAAEPVGIALRKQDRDLSDAIAHAVELMRQDGTLRTLENHWFGTELGDFRPESPGFWEFSTRIVLPRILTGLGLTLELTAVCGVLGIALGLLLSLARLARNHVVNRLALAYVTLFRGTPLLLQVLFFFFALPSLLGVRLSALTSGILALSFNAAAYITEIFRAAIQSIDRGQMEAARSLGMSYAQAMRRVILPQTFRRLIPPLVNEAAALSKDTSLVSVLALHEMLYETQRLAASYLRPWEVYAWAALGYLVIVLALSGLAGHLERRLEATGA